MKKKNEIYFHSIRHAFRDYIVAERMISLGNSFELPALFKELGWRLLSACFPQRVKFTNRLAQLHRFSGYLLQMVKHRGARTTVLYLKACQLAVQKKIAKDKIESLRDLEPNLSLPRLSHSGLPRIIPLSDRRAIASGSVSCIRWWLTIFSVYRVIQIPGVLKLNTITDSFTGNLGFKEVIKKELVAIATSNFSKFSFSPKPAILLLLETASPGFKTSWTGFFKMACLLRDSRLDESMRVIARHFKSNDFLEFFDSCLELEMACQEQDPAMVNASTGSSIFFNPSEKKGSNGLELGQLSIKEEAAGKVRVFALVDIWTQSVLKPIHDLLFSYLRSLPNDGTFDQHASVTRCFEKSKLAKSSYGYDLSAATDRLPIDLQVSVLSALIGQEASKAWEDLLVNRDYILSDKKYGNHVVRYSVGQPMGALSSWAMLAVTHHFLVQVAAKQSGRSRPGHWYDNYELLGDDINIFDKVVAERYLLIMEGLGVGITLSKSVVATTAAFEFAKVTGFKGKNVSAISWKMFISQNTMMGRVNIAFSLIRKGIIDHRPVAWLRNIMAHSCSSKGHSFSLVALLSMYANSGLLKTSDLLKALMNKESPSKLLYKNVLDNVRIAYLENLLAQLVKGIPVSLDASARLRSMWIMDETWLKGLFSKPISAFLKSFKDHSWAISLSKDMVVYVICLPETEEAVRHHLMMDESSRVRNAINDIHRQLVSVLRIHSRHLLAELVLTERSDNCNSTQLMLLTHAQAKVQMGYTWELARSQTIDYWMEKTALLERFQELIQLVERARTKALKAPAALVRKDTPLKAIKLLIRSRVKRPMSSYYQLPPKK